ncbi:hypothetical protein H5S09_02640 [Limosilactobacillus sp. STM2_1]|uniref:Lj965 prophage protein n=1 Tax=Limosilactobacillus rudii TaxID=2759755 RepID=A0A7W3UJR0_9LACO|nr:hypothetical protein [Limosilactobacillus rudii]MBB1080248.1 hypothetical protein [Limosilactobacillus rudii]MBB1096848.1 hypothetical protein [Limosilactobacillus rudii]MCD7133746.1 hypothetical protein [Limosilactobacillus rudii]
MEIYNVKALAFKTLKSIPELRYVSTSYPDKFTTFPTAIYKTTQASYVRNNKQEETDTEWQITIDLYNDKGSLTQIKNKLIAKFSAMGFSNSIGDQDLNGVTRVVLVFTGIVDNTSKRVYQKG